MEKALERLLGENQMLNEVLRCLIQADEEAGYTLMAADSVARQLDERQVRETVAASLLCADEEYSRLIREWGVLRPTEYAHRLGIHLVRETTEPTAAFPYFALYHAQPPSITIAQTTIFRTEHIIAQAGLEPLLGRVDLEELAVAHELFHHLEHMRSDIYTVKLRVDVAWFAGLRRQRRLQAAGEVAGRHFSKRLMGLSYSPRVFEIILKQVAVREDEYD